MSAGNKDQMKVIIFLYTFFSLFSAPPLYVCDFCFRTVAQYQLHIILSFIALVVVSFSSSSSYCFFHSISLSRRSTPRSLAAAKMEFAFLTLSCLFGMSFVIFSVLFLLALVVTLTLTQFQPQLLRNSDTGLYMQAGCVHGTSMSCPIALPFFLSWASFSATIN